MTYILKSETTMNTAAIKQLIDDMNVIIKKRKKENVSTEETPI